MRGARQLSKRRGDSRGRCPPQRGLDERHSWRRSEEGAPQQLWSYRPLADSGLLGLRWQSALGLHGSTFVCNRRSENS